MVLASVLAGVDRPGRWGALADVAASLTHYENLRRPRTTSVQSASRAPVAGADLSWIYGFDADAPASDDRPAAALSRGGS